MSKKKHKHKKNNITLPTSNSSDQNPLVADNPIQARDGSGIISHREASAFSGPIPPPDLLERYNQMIPDGANRILKMAENQSTHRQYIEKWAIIGGTILSYLGVLCAAGIALGSLYIGSKLIQSGYVIPGSLLGGGGLTGLVAAFIYGTRSRREERERRNRLNKELIRQR